MRLNSAIEISFTSGILRSALRLRSFHPAGGPLSMLRRSCSDLGLYLLDMAILLVLKGLDSLGVTDHDERIFEPRGRGNRRMR